MDRLSGLDSAFFALDTPTSTGHVGGLTILDPAPPRRRLTLARLSELYAERLPLAPVLRRRLISLPFGIDRPYWVDDPDFDLTYHMREDGLPKPGSDEQLAELVSRLHARPLDRDRPLWEATLITGLAGGRVAIYIKVHHAAIDGVSGADLLTVLTDPEPRTRKLPPPEPWDPPPLPSTARLGLRTARDVVSRPVDLARITWGAVRASPRLLPALGVGRDSPARVGRTTSLVDGRTIDPNAGVAPPTPLNRAITPHRVFAFTQLPLAEVKAVKNAFGVSVNDVVVALCAGVLRTWLLDRDALPEHPLVAMVPISLRPDTAHDLKGNRVSAMFPQVPTHLADPLARLEATHQAALHARGQHGLLPQDLFDDVADFTPPLLTTAAFRLVFDTNLRNRLPLFNLVISNVPGPSDPMYVLGSRIAAHYPLSVVTDGMGLNITVLSYCGSVDFGLVADRTVVPDVADLAADLRPELDALLDAAGVERQQAPS